MADPAIAGSWASASVRRVRERCRRDLLYLCAEVLGPFGVKTGEFPKNHLRTPSRFHIEAAKIVESEEDALFLAPRFHLKTVLITIGGSIQFLLRNTEHRVLLVSETPTLVSKVLTGMKAHFIRNEKFRRLFPEYRMDDAKEQGTLNHFTVPCRKGSGKEFSVEAIGIGGATAGGHYDRIVTTDVVSNLTVPPKVTEETMAKTFSDINALEGLRDPTIRRKDGKRKAHIIIEGTRWHGADAYGRVIENKGYKNFKKVIYSCWAKDEKGSDIVLPNGKRQVLWPEVFSSDEFEETRLKNEYLFSCLFENDPQPAADDCLFLPSYFKHYEVSALGDDLSRPTCPCCQGPLEVRITADLAISQARTADYTALPVTGVCPRGSLVILATPRGRWSPFETVEELYTLDALWKPSWIGIESVAWQKAMVHILHEESKKSGRYMLPVWEMVPDNSPNGKLRRIGMLAAYAASRGVWVRPGDHDIFVDECLRMTRRGSLTGHDDLCDAVGYVVTWIARPDAPAIEEEVGPPRLMGASCITGAELLAHRRGSQKFIS